MNCDVTRETGNGGLCLQVFLSPGDSVAPPAACSLSRPRLIRCARMMRAPDWLPLLLFVLLLPPGCAHMPDICEAKPRELPLEPRCPYRGPIPSPAPTPEAESPPDSTNPRVWELSQANSRFALRLLAHVTSTRSPSANVLLAPLSVSAAFAMTRPAACDRTLQQLMEVSGGRGHSPFLILIT